MEWQVSWNSCFALIATKEKLSFFNARMEPGGAIPPPAPPCSYATGSFFSSVTHLPEACLAMWGLQSFYFIESKLYLKSRTTSNKYLLERVDFLKKKIASLGHFLYLPLAISRKLSYNSCTEMNFQYELLYLTIALVSGAMRIPRSTFYVVMT